MSAINDAAILAVSDSHLGPIGKFQGDLLDLFHLLNSNRKSGRFPHLQAFFILGDLFDVILDNYISIRQNPIYDAIFKEIDDLYNKGIPVIMTLGNHEISFSGDFKTHKQKILTNFKRYGYNYSFLHENLLCQYAIMDHLDTNSALIKLYDSDEELVLNTPFNTLQIQIKLKPDQRMLFTHGHQFPRRFSKFSCFFFWDPLFEKQERYSEFRQFLIDTKLDPNLGIEEWAKSHPKWEVLQIRQQLLKESIYKVKDKNFLHKILNGFKLLFDFYIQGACSRGAIYYLRRHKLTNITHIVFGHIHSAFLKPKKYKYNKHHIVLANTGGWDGPSKPTAISINPDGTTALYEFIADQKKAILKKGLE
jgi:UDP-2,3-diacylglucosamine pyrophosphatase LpxH